MAFDVTGALTSTLGVTALVYGLVQSATAGWSSTRTVGPLLAGVVLLAWFALAEVRAVRPILPLRLLASPTRSGANAARGLVFAGAYGMFFYLSQYLQEVRGFSPVQAGLAFLPVPLAVFAASQLATRLVGRYPARRLVLAGLALSALGLGLNTQFTPHPPYGLVLAGLMLVGAGNGISFVTLTGAALADVAPEDAGAASGLVNVSQQLGAAIGVAVLVTVFGRSAASGVGTAAGALRFTDGVDRVFVGSTLLVLTALAPVTVTGRTRRPAPVVEPVVQAA